MTYKGKLKDWAVTLSKAGDPLVMIKFEIPELKKDLVWYGSLKVGKPREITTKTLLYCGFKSDNIQELQDLNALERQKELDLEVVEQEYNGRKSLKIEWVNLPGTGSRKFESDIKAIEALNSLDLRGDFAAVRETTGIKADQEIPF